MNLNGPNITDTTLKKPQRAAIQLPSSEPAHRLDPSPSSDKAHESKANKANIFAEPSKKENPGRKVLVRFAEAPLETPPGVTKIQIWDESNTPLNCTLTQSAKKATESRTLLAGETPRFPPKAFESNDLSNGTGGQQRAHSLAGYGELWTANDLEKISISGLLEVLPETNGKIAASRRTKPNSIIVPKQNEDTKAIISSGISYTTSTASNNRIAESMEKDVNDNFCSVSDSILLGHDTSNTSPLLVHPQLFSDSERGQLDSGKSQLGSSSVINVLDNQSSPPDKFVETFMHGNALGELQSPPLTGFLPGANDQKPTYDSSIFTSPLESTLLGNATKQNATEQKIELCNREIDKNIMNKNLDVRPRREQMKNQVGVTWNGPIEISPDHDTHLLKLKEKQEVSKATNISPPLSFAFDRSALEFGPQPIAKLGRRQYPRPIQYVGPTSAGNHSISDISIGLNTETIHYSQSNYFQSNSSCISGISNDDTATEVSDVSGKAFRGRSASPTMRRYSVAAATAASLPSTARAISTSRVGVSSHSITRHRATGIGTYNGKNHTLDESVGSTIGLVTAPAPYIHIGGAAIQTMNRKQQFNLDCSNISIGTAVNSEELHCGSAESLSYGHTTTSQMHNFIAPQQHIQAQGVSLSRPGVRGKLPRAAPALHTGGKSSPIKIPESSHLQHRYPPLGARLQHTSWTFEQPVSSHHTTSDNSHNRHVSPHGTEIIDQQVITATGAVGLADTSSLTGFSQISEYRPGGTIGTSAIGMPSSAPVRHGKPNETGKFFPTIY